MSEKKSKIFLTGSTGFIGKNIIEKLSDKYNIFSPTSVDLNLLNAEEVLTFLKKEKFDFILHSAAQGVSLSTSANIFQDNLKMFFHITRGCKYFKRMFYFGSGAEYDKRRDIIRVKEDDFDQSVPVDEYGLSKYVCTKYSEQCDFVINLRLFGVYGKYEDYSRRMISNVICLSLLDLPVVLKQDCYFDYIYINDVVDILDLFLKKENLDHKSYNICRGEKYLLSDIARLILKKLGKPESELKILNPGMNREYTADNSRLISELGDYQYTDLEKGIDDLIVYYKNNLDNIDRSKLL